MPLASLRCNLASAVWRRPGMTCSRLGRPSGVYLGGVGTHLNKSACWLRRSGLYFPMGCRCGG
jgi:hypothetical protein